LEVGLVQFEEVEVLGTAVDIAAHDQRGATGEAKAFGFFEPSDDLSDLTLERCQQ
jgi:hypothetical protein